VRELVPHSHTRVRQAMIAAVVVMVSVGLAGPVAARADPGAGTLSPHSVSKAVARYKKLAEQAEKLNEDYLAAKHRLGKRKHQLAKANHEVKHAKTAERAAKAKEEKYRSRVDELSTASYEGAQFSQFSALLTGESPQDFLKRAAALRVISSNKNTVVQRLASATDTAERARRQAADGKRRAQDATNASNQLIADIKQRSTVLQKEFSSVRAALDKLSPEARKRLTGSGDKGVYIAPPGVAGKAMEAALSQRGVPYVWGGQTPGKGFDCSGLVEWAFAKAGISLPHSSRAQSHVGKPVPRSQLRPGDLVFFGHPVHHVGIYVGDGKMVDAPTFGEPVQVDSLFSGYSGARRLGAAG
jgi:cell wall-associated NlpC family hydrolase